MVEKTKSIKALGFWACGVYIRTTVNKTNKSTDPRRRSQYVVWPFDITGIF
jgi:hypothetical protein